MLLYLSERSKDIVKCSKGTLPIKNNISSVTSFPLIFMCNYIPKGELHIIRGAVHRIYLQCYSHKHGWRQFSEMKPVGLENKLYGSFKMNYPSY